MQATFGPSRESLRELGEHSDYMSWIRTQMQKPVGSHREYYRARSNSRTVLRGLVQSEIMTARSRCSAGAMWNRFAFTADDINLEVVADGTNIYVNGTFRTNINSDYSFHNITAPTECNNTRPSWRD
eukprot:227842-Amphidinium_carterae.1